MSFSSEGEITRRGLLGGALGLAAGALMPCAASAQAPEAVVKPPTAPSRVKFRKRVINEASDFEAASAADINGDGILDIVSGDTWYQAPHWTPHRFREIELARYLLHRRERRVMALGPQQRKRVRHQFSKLHTPLPFR